MLLSSFYILPCLVCLLWSILFLIKKKKSRSQNYLLIVLLLGVVYYGQFSVFLSSSLDYNLMVHLDAICQFMVPLWMALHAIYIESHLKVNYFTDTIRHCLFIPAFIHGGNMLVVYYMIGFDSAASFWEQYDLYTLLGKSFFENPPVGFTDTLYHIYHFISVKQYHVVCLALCSLSFYMGLCVMKRQSGGFKSVYHFLFKHGSLTPGSVTSSMIMIIILLQCPIMIIGRSYIITKPMLGLTLALFEAIFIFIMGYVEYMGHVKTLTLSSMTNFDFNTNSTESSIELKSETTSKEITERNIDISDDEAQELTVLSKKINNLMERLDQAFVEEKVYKNPDLTLQMLADMLHTNRTTLSTVLKYKYKMTFKEYLSYIRIEKAKEYVILHPDDVMENVAYHCGFNGASNFSHKFKDEVGMSPSAFKFANMRNLDDKEV